MELFAQRQRPLALRTPPSPSMYFPSLLGLSGDLKRQRRSQIPIPLAEFSGNCKKRNYESLTEGQWKCSPAATTRVKKICPRRTIYNKQSLSTIQGGFVKLSIFLHHPFTCLLSSQAKPHEFAGRSKEARKVPKPCRKDGYTRRTA